MATETMPTNDTRLTDTAAELAATVPQGALGLLPRSSAWVARAVVGRSADDVHGVPVLVRSLLAAGIGFAAFLGLALVCFLVLVLWGNVFPKIVGGLAAAGLIAGDSGWVDLRPPAPMMHPPLAIVAAYLIGMCFPLPYDEIGRPFRVLRGFLWIRGVAARLTSMLFLLGFGLLPLASLILFLPMVMPGEAVLTDTVPAQRRRDRNVRRLLALGAGLTLSVALLTFAVTMVTWFGLRSNVYGSMARNLFGTSVADRLPAALLEGWPFVLLIVYALDFLLLFLIGRVPLSYNFRNLRVRWITTLMTGIAFTVVVFLLILMSSFVDSVNRLTANSGIPGNVFVLSEGSTDELFSSLGYGDIGKLELEEARTDVAGRPLTKIVKVKETPGRNGAPATKWVSKETYFVINQEIAKPGSGPARRFVQLRGIDDGETAGKVHDITLSKGEWFGREGGVQVGTGSRTAVPCVLGEGAASAFGADYGRDKLDVGDTFQLGDEEMIVVGVMKSAGRTFDSETWATNARVSKSFGKQAFTTVVLRVADDDPETSNVSAQRMADHLTKNFTSPRVRAVTETKYYEDLAKSNAQLMFMVVVVAIIMALGGVIGVMLVMFAAISQRIKDIGVLRVIGYKRWQILVSFMLESLAIALVGGLLGVAIILIVNGVASAGGEGLSVTSNVSSGQASKTIVTKLYFGTDVLAGGLLFTVVMGRLGGLLPSVGAMRLGILESLR